MNNNDLQNMLKNIKEQPVVVENIEQYVCDSQISKKSKVKNLECSVMFVDMRNSTDMTDENGSKNMVKIYKMFTRLVVTAVEEFKGHVAQIMGDGMLCIFTKKGENSGQCAMRAALKINEYLEQVYNKMVEPSWKIKCGIGIRTGHIYMTRVGVKGKNKSSKVVYPSSITNYSCKLCNVAKEKQILFDDVTYKQLNKDFQTESINIEKNKIDKCKSMEGDIWKITC